MVKLTQCLSVGNTKSDGKSYVFQNGRMVGVRIKQSSSIKLMTGSFYPSRQIIVFDYLPVCNLPSRVLSNPPTNQEPSQMNQRDHGENADIPDINALNLDLHSNHSPHTYPSSSSLTILDSQECKMKFKVSKTVWEYNAMRNVFLFSGLSRTETVNGWSVFWGKHLSIDHLSGLKPWQRVNHFPGSSHLGRKDELGRNLEMMKTLFGSHDFSFAPETYTIPEDYDIWQQIREHGGTDQKCTSYWIRKPLNGSCGTGISLLRLNPSDPLSGGYIHDFEECVIQRYVHNPLLIDHRKFDLRLYVLVTSFNPLVVYFYNEGIVRFSVKPYNLQKWRDVSVHLTNYSLQKNQKNYSFDKSKWPLSKLLNHLAKKKGRIKVNQMMEDIEKVIIKTLVSVQRTITNRMRSAQCEWDQCFELYGFDILIDQHWRPVLMEVNLLPSFSSSSPFDKQLKSTLLTDTFHLIGVPLKGSDSSVKCGTSSSVFEMDKNINCMNNNNNIDRAEMTGVNMKKKQETMESRIKRMLLGCEYLEIGEDQRTILRLLCDQFDRTGEFRRIFPLRERFQSFVKYFGYFGEIGKKPKMTHDVMLWSFLQLDQPTQNRVLQGLLTRIPNALFINRSDSSAASMRTDESDRSFQESAASWSETTLRSAATLSSMSELTDPTE